MRARTTGDFFGGCIDVGNLALGADGDQRIEAAFEQAARVERGGAQPFFGAFLFGDVEDDTVQPERAALPVVVRASAFIEPLGAVAAELEPVGDFVRGARYERPLDRRDDHIHFVRINEVGQPEFARQEALLGDSGDGFDAVADVAHAPGPLDVAAIDDPRGVFDQGSELFEALLDLGGRLAHVLLVADVEEDHDQEDQAQAQSAGEDQPRLIALGQILELPAAAEAGSPAMPADDDLPVGHVARDARRRFRAEQQVPRHGLAVEEFDLDLRRRHRKQGTHQVPCPERRIDEAAQRRTAFGDGIQRHPPAIDGFVDHEARLDVDVRLLHEDDLPRQRLLAAVPGAFHRLAAHGLGVHVVAEGTLVAVGERLEEDDAGERVAFAGRGDRVAGKAFGTDGRLVRGAFAWPQHHRIAEPQHPRQLAGQVVGGDEALPLCAAHRVARIEHTAPCAQYLLIALHVLAEQGLLLLDAIQETLFRALPGMLFHVVPQPHGEADHEQENCPAQPRLVLEPVHPLQGCPLATRHDVKVFRHGLVPDCVPVLKHIPMKYSEDPRGPRRGSGRGLFAALAGSGKSVVCADAGRPSVATRDAVGVSETLTAGRPRPSCTPAAAYGSSTWPPISPWHRLCLCLWQVLRGTGKGTRRQHSANAETR